MNPLDIIEKYCAKGSPLYHILVTHSAAVRDRALKIAAKHSELNIDTEFVSEAAMLHDIGIIYTNAPGIECYGTHNYVEHGFLGAELLRSLGYEKHALVCERHTGTGLTEEIIKEQHINIPPRDMRPVTIEEQVICYADKFYSKAHLERELDIEGAIAKFNRHPEHKNDIERFIYWSKLFE